MEGTMEQLKRQNLKLLDEVDGVRAKLRARTAMFETDRDAWRERERFLERKLAAYESNAGKRPTVGSVGRSTAEMESLTEETSETFHDREKKLAELQRGVTVMNGAIETLTTQLQECKQELMRFEVEQGKWKDKERFLELKIRDYKKQMDAVCGERESGEAVIKESSAETERSINPQSGHVPGQIIDLQKVVEGLKQEISMNKSKDFEKEKERFRKREKELQMKIQLLESQVAELSEKPRLQSKTAEKPCREMAVQTDVTIQRINERAAEVKDLQEEYDNVTYSLRNTVLKLNKERAEWREQRLDLVERATVSESKLKAAEEGLAETEKALEKARKEFDDLREETSKEHLVMGPKLIVLEQERDSLEETVALLKEESTQKDEAARRQQDKASTSETPAVDLDSIILQQLDNMEIQRVRALVHRVRSQCSQRADALEEERDRLSEIAQMLSGELQEHETKYHTMEQKVIVLLKERDSLEETVALLKEESTQKDEALQRKWEKASRSGTAAMTETQSELGADDSQAKQQLTLNKSKEHDFEKEKERFSKREKELQMKIQLLESQVTELSEKVQGDCPQRENADKPCREMEVQTDFTMQTIDEREHEWKEEFKYLVLRLQSEQFNFNKERAEWRKQRQDLEERVAASESEKSNQKECDELKEESLKEEKLIVLEQERDSLEETVALLKEESTQQDKASTSETPAVDLDSIILQQLDNMELPRGRALVHRLHSHCSPRADALEEERDRLSEIAQMLSGKLEEHETNEVRLEAESEEFKRRAVEAETQLRKAQDDVVRMEKAFREERDMFQEMAEKLHDLQKDNADLNTTVENLKQQRRELEENANVFKTSGATGALVSELMGRLKHEATLREFQWEREKYLMARQERLDDNREKTKRVEERATLLSEKNTKISAMFDDEREKTKRLEKKAEDASLKAKQMKKKQDDALHWISKLTETKERLETALEEAREINKEHTAKEEHWTRAREKLLSQIESQRATKDVNQSKKERKGFFSRIFRRRD